MNRMQNWSIKRILVLVTSFITLFIGGFLLLCQLLSGQAAQIFNNYMDKQRVFVGRVTAEELSADL